MEVGCSDESSPKIVSVIPYPIINNDALSTMICTNVSCMEAMDGSIVYYPTERNYKE